MTAPPVHETPVRTAPVDATPLTSAERAAWERAQALWGVRMSDARMLPGAGIEQEAPAWFTFPPAIVVDPDMVVGLGAADELESVFAHELGHHALAPSTRIDALKIRHQLARALAAAGSTPVRPQDVALLSNLWTDLLVNTRVALLQRRRDGAAAEPGIVRLSRILYAPGHGTARRIWWVYLRAYELLWNLPAGALCALDAPAAARLAAPVALPFEQPLSAFDEKLREKEKALRAARREAARIAAELDSAVTTHPAVDADDVARIVRTFASDPVAGALRFGVVMAPYLVEEEKARRHAEAARRSADAQAAADGEGDGAEAAGGFGACSADDGAATAEELGRMFADRRLHEGVPSRERVSDPAARSDDDPQEDGQGFGVAQTLALYTDSDPEAVLAAWYRSEASRWVQPFTQRAPARPEFDLPGPLEAWEVGDDLVDLDWSATLQAGPAVVPGVTTRRRSFLEDEPERAETGIELDLYIDSSGSMQNPSRGSAAVLAGTILALSVLRGGGRVRVTSFSGPGQVAGGETFTRDHVRIVRDLAFFFGRSTSFPLDLLAQRYDPLPSLSDDVRRHLVVLSDDGLVSMFGVGNEPHAGVAERVRAKLTTATLVVLDRARSVEPLATAAGYDMLYVDTMDDAPRACARLAEVLHG